jgi:D-glycero-D-manno-heptose 1,7-bisphosphate phosphatase
MRPAVFLDRDGTLIEDRGHLRTPEDVVFFADTIPALRELRNEFLLFIVTQQSGIARGLITSEHARTVNNHVVDLLAAAGITILEVYCCPHDRADGCRCIKPNPFHLHQAANDYDVDLTRSFVMGDHPHDVELACRAGATGIYLLTGHGKKHQDELPPDVIVADGIGNASRFALQMLGPGRRDESPESFSEENA